MQSTPNLGLRKPEQTDFYDVDDFNYNADILDTKIQEVAEQVEGIGEFDTDSPEFTGEPTAPTQPENDNSDKLATTKYVIRGIGTHNNDPNAHPVLDARIEAVANSMTSMQGDMAAHKAEAMPHIILVNGTPRPFGWAVNGGIVSIVYDDGE